jgi:hypothetical protein
MRGKVRFKAMSMKFHWSAVLVACLHTPAVLAQSERPAQQLRSSFETDCINRGLERGGKQQSVTAFCTCSWAVLARSLTVQEYVDIDLADFQGQKLADQGPLRRIVPQLQACKEHENDAAKP